MTERTLPFPPSPSECASWVIAAVLLVAVVKFHLLAALFSGMLVHELVHILAPWLRRGTTAPSRAKIFAVALLSSAIVAALTTLILLIASFLQGGSENLSQLAALMAESLEGSREVLPANLINYLPDNLEEIEVALAEWLRQHATELKTIGGEALRTLAHILIGMVVGAIISLREVVADAPRQPLSAALSERIVRFAHAYRQIVFSQVRIAALNAFLTGLYLMVVLPLSGVHLPYTKTLLAVTFFAGLLPVLGNLISNTVIVIVSLSVSFQIALVSLAFLVIIHKLEYFANARIIGQRINARTWELLLAMLLMEALFGVRGLIAAPVFYAYLKSELKAYELI